MREFLKPYRYHIFALVMFNNSYYLYGRAKQSDSIFWWILTILQLIIGIYCLLKVFKVINRKDFDDE